MRVLDKEQRLADRLSSPWVKLFGRSVCAYQFFGVVGLAVASVLATSLALYQGLSPIVLAAVLLAGVVTFFVLILARLVLTGEEHITYYHHELAVLTVAAALLRFWSQPLLPYLDLTILGIGVVLVFGRLGCFRMGCCHGRPALRGTRYRQEHVDTGFPRQYVGVTIFPIQLVESGWVLGLVVICSAMVASGRPAGSALSLYVMSYAVGRFCFEFMRGDPGRLYLWGFSEAQWISIAVVFGVVAGEMAGGLPFSSWHLTAAVTLLIAMIGVAVRRARDRAGLHSLLSARHIEELAEVLDRIGQDTADRDKTAACRTTPAANRQLGDPCRIAIARTSLGVQISNGDVAAQGSSLSHFTLSRRDEPMNSRSARAVAGVIRQLARGKGSCRILEGKHGVFHVLISPV